jgi:MFS family permease
MTNNPFFLIFSILIFGFGEMAGSPKITEYIGRIAPKDKVALYMGCSYLPVALGSYLAGIVSGPVYQRLSDKVSLLRREFLSQGIDVEGLTQSELFARAYTEFNLDAAGLTQLLWDKYHPSSIWYVVSAIGLTAAAALWLYDKFLLKENHEQ